MKGCRAVLRVLGGFLEVQLCRVRLAAFVGGEVVVLRWPWQCVGEALSKQVGAQGGGVQKELILKFRDSPRRRRTR